MEENKKEITKYDINSLSLDMSTNEIINSIIEEENSSKLKDLTHLFKVHMAKKNIIRMIKYYDMIDLVSEQTLLRLEKKPDEITTKDLLALMTGILSTIEKTNDTLGALDDTTSGLTINQQKNEVNINVAGASLDRESKERVVDAIKSLMSLMSSTKSNDNVIDVETDDKEENE
jgi:hypothetical protein